MESKTGDREDAKDAKEEACEEGFSIISPGEHIPSQAVAPACKLPEDALEQSR